MKNRGNNGQPLKYARNVVWKEGGGEGERKEEREGEGREGEGEEENEAN